MAILMKAASVPFNVVFGAAEIMFSPVLMIVRLTAFKRKEGRKIWGGRQRCWALCPSLIVVLKGTKSRFRKLTAKPVHELLYIFGPNSVFTPQFIS
jgi:hypothetical protein